MDRRRLLNLLMERDEFADEPQKASKASWLIMDAYHDVMKYPSKKDREELLDDFVAWVKREYGVEWEFENE